MNESLSADMELLGKVLVAVLARVGAEAWPTWWTRCRRPWPGGGPRWTGARRSLTLTNRTAGRRGRRRARALANLTVDTAARRAQSRPSQVGGVIPRGGVSAETRRSGGRSRRRPRASCPPASDVWPQVRGCRVTPALCDLCTPDELLSRNLTRHILITWYIETLILISTSTHPPHTLPCSCDNSFKQIVNTPFHQIESSTFSLTFESLFFLNPSD